MFTIENKLIKIVISAKGAELQSVYNKQTALEYMWSGDAAFWGKKSPVLFPIVGGLKHNTYFFNGNEYHLSRHGFARETTFTVTEQTNNSITFSIAWNEETLKVYPFHFNFSVVYTLNEAALKVSYVIENTGNELMYFSVGAHPAFKIPLVEGTTYDDYFLLFSDNENAGQWPLSADGLIKNEPIPLLNNTNKLSLTKQLFYGDALVFKHLQSNKISIVSNKANHGLSVQYNGFPYMGIWSAKDADFVCIEPWCGIADSVDSTQDITKKEGIIKLEPNNKFEASWLADFF